MVRRAEPIGERAPGRLDDRLHRGEVVDLDPDGVDGDLGGALGDQHVLPEVAEPPGPPGLLLQVDQPGGEARARPSPR